MHYQGRPQAVRVVAPIGWLCLFIASLLVTAYATPSPSVPLAQRTDALIDKLQASKLITDAASGISRLPAIPLQIEHCGGYPHEALRDAPTAHADLLDDLRIGLAKGLSCLAGTSAAGRLHPYHEYQAHRLLNLFEHDQTKTLRCVSDEMFATAVATGPNPLGLDDPLYKQLKRVTYPAIVLDTYRLGGLLSRTHDDETFRSFFHLNDAQIFEHRYGLPIRAKNLHRFKNRPALLFHEVVHWLGHQHSAIRPDMAHLYETCCFGGSDYIDDRALNRGHQQTACDILRDDALWQDSFSPYRRMRVWHHKGYDEFKKTMRDDYTR